MLSFADQSFSGCSAQDVLAAIGRVFHENAATGPYQVLDPSIAGIDTRHSLPVTRLQYTVWGWLISRDDVHIIHPTKAKLSNSESLPLSHNSEPIEWSTHGHEMPHYLIAKEISVCTSEDTRWESITGHSRDVRRVLPLEWDLLQGIASTRDEGILQADLCRLVKQDKRSVPKRTDSLLKKGYLIKRTTLVHGTKTSRMWLRSFAPAVTQEDESTNLDAATLQLNSQAHEALMYDLEPVPWHEKWTGESVDYAALSTTLMAIIKQWDVIRIRDLKTKLGILGMQWQMKVLARICRVLNRRGAIQYTAARLQERIFKDCIRFARDLTAQDFAVLYAAGKCREQFSESHRDQMDDGSEDETSLKGANAAWLASLPSWVLGQPMTAYLVEIIKGHGKDGATNTDLCLLSLGPSFGRFVSSLTAAASTELTQPSHLQHLQVTGQHVRDGKVAFYKFFVPVSRRAARTTESTSDLLPHSFPTDHQCGFSDPLNNQSSSNCLTRQAAATTLLPRKGRQNSQLDSSANPSDKLDLRQLESQKSNHEAVRGLATVKIASSQNFIRESDSPALRFASELAPSKSTVQRLSLSPPHPQQSQSNHSLQTHDVGDMDYGYHRGHEDQITVTNPQATTKRSQSSSDDTPRKITRADQVSELQPTAIEQPLPESGTPTMVSQTPQEASCLQGTISRRSDSGTARGRPTRKSRAQGKVRVTRGNRGAAASPNFMKSWVCDKCGGKWKNDIGLKYHLEKSKTTCNPTWNPAEDQGRQARKSSARSYNTRITAATKTTETRRGSEDAVVPSVRSSQRLTDRDYQEPDENEHDEAGACSIAEATVALCRPERGVNRAFRSQCSSRQPFHHRITGNSGPLLSMSSCHSRLAHFSAAGSALSDYTVPNRMKSKLGSFHDDKNMVSSMTMTTSSQPTAQSGSTATSEVPDTTTRSRTKCDAVSDKNGSVNVYTRITSIIERCLDREDGVLPGNESLVYIVRHCWASAFPDDPTPNEKECRTALRQMIRKGIICDHWQGFRTLAGNFSNCQIITWPDTDPLSDTCVDLVEKIQGAVPEPFVPARYIGTMGTALTRSGRRDLPASVAILNAPVYAAQATPKRPLDESAGARYSHIQKKRRTSSKTSLGQQLARSKQRDSAADWHTAWSCRSAPQNKSRSPGEPWSASASLQRRSRSLEFVEPDAYSSGDESLARIRSGGRLSQASRSLTQTHDPAKRSSAFVKPNSVRDGSDKDWPNLGLGDLEDTDLNLTKNGWVPDPTWYKWVSIASDIARPSSYYHNFVSHSSNQADLYNRFVQCLKEFERQEMSKIDDFVNAPPVAAGPHNIFLSLTGPSVASFEPQRLPKWPAIQYQNFTAPAYAGQGLLLEATDISSDDDLEIDPMLSTTYSAISGSVAKSRHPSLGVKRVLLTTRGLMPILPVEETSAATRTAPATMDSCRPVVSSITLTAAIIAVRALLGGVELAIDWAFLDKLYPALGVDFIQEFWFTFASSEPRRAADMTESLQQKFIKAYERDEVPKINFDDPAACDWTEIIDWTAACCDLAKGNLPATLEDFDARFEATRETRQLEDWRNDFFHIQSSVFSRFEWLTAEAASVSSVARKPSTADRNSITDLTILRSWVRSLCCASSAKFSTQEIMDKFSSLQVGTGVEPGRLLGQAIQQLIDERVIRRNHKPALAGRTYQLSDIFDNTLEKLTHRDKYREARKLKAGMDAAFRRGEPYNVPYALSNGESMALTNLNAAKRITIRPVKLPQIPFGFEPGNYESRKYPKRYYHFKIEALPTTVYLYDDEIDVLRQTQSVPPASGSSRGELPQWVNFAGEVDLRRWKDILAASCFALATRGPMRAAELCDALDPILEPFESDMIADWGKRTGVLRELDARFGVTVGEWWWLAVPWQYLPTP